MRRSPLLPIFLIVLVDVLGMTIVIPLLAIYSERFGASPLVATLLMSSFAACQLVSGPILGALSDRFGRRPILLVSQIGTMIGFIILANANALWMVFAGRILDGATAGNLGIAQAYIADHTPPDKRAQSFALIGIAFGTGFAFGPVISGWLSHYALETPFWVAAGLSGCSILGTWFILPREIGFAFAGSAFIGLIIQGGLIRRLVPRYGEARLAIVGFVALAVGYPFLGAGSALSLLAIATFFSSIGNSLLRPALTALVTKHAGAHEQGIALGLTQSLSSLAAMASPPLAGWLIEHGHGAVWAMLLGGVGLVGAAVMIGADRSPAPANDYSR